jgi:hypothetical protein
MDCRAFRQLHGDWVDDVLDPQEHESLARHIAECASCARFDTLARRALMVARSAPQLEVSADFSSRLASRLAEERRARIAEIRPSHVERQPLFGTYGKVRFRTAAAVALVFGGSYAARAILVAPRNGSANTATFEAASFTGGDETALPASAISAMTGVSTGDIVVVQNMRPIGGALLPLSDDPLLDGSATAGMGDARATSLAATAPLWPTAQMAAHAANRFAAMEFGDMRPVSIVQISH